MVVTQFGRVEVDPMRVPLAAAMGTGRRESFAKRLDAAADAANEAPASRRCDAATEEPHAADPAPVAAEPRTPDATPEPASPVESELPAVTAGAVAVDTQIPSRGEPARRIAASEGAGAPIASSPAVARGAAASAAPAATTASRLLLAGVAGVTGSAVVPAGVVGRSATGDRALATAGAEPAARGAKTAAAAGYRTLNRQSVQLVEQARDSVFRQILFRLGKDRGEMRLLLDPPELGELDLHLLVEKGGNLRLSIGAERADLASMLQNDLEQLKHALQQQGLQVTHAEVHTQPGGQGRRGDTALPAAAADGDDADEDSSALPRVGMGYVNAQGLDFWA